MIGIEHGRRRTTALGDAHLVRAAQNGDVASLGVLLERHHASLYALAAEDAEVRIVNRETPPSSPHVLRGRERIAAYLRDVCGRDIESRIEDEVIGEERVAFNEACTYPDETRVLTATTLEVRDGKISRQVSIEAWDE